MNGIRLCRMSARLSVLGLVVLFAACRQRGADTEKPAAGIERNSSSDAPAPPRDVAPEQSTEPELLVAPFDAESAKTRQKAWADHLGVSMEITNSIGMKLALIPAGEFMMGSPDFDNEYQHKVRITKPFFLSVHEVTQKEYERVMGTNPSCFSSNGEGKHEVSNLDTNRFPVEQVSWDEATEFCKRLSAKEGKTYRLPTEAEWEYACRAGTRTEYGFGDDPASLGEYAWYNINLVGRTRPVGKKKANAWGLHDMHGNALEWCQDWYWDDYYRESPVDDPQGPSSGDGRVIRGGSWYDGAEYCRSAFRFWCQTEERLDYQGFRVAAVPPNKSSQAQVK